MANLYSTPAEAEFINTYVPIQFEQLNRLSEKSERNIEIGTALMDDLYAYQSLGSFSDAANQAWDEKFFSPVKQFIENNVRDPRDLSNPSVISGLMKLKRDISSSGDVKALMESKEAYKETLKNVDPRWRDTYREMIRAHNPLESGIWSEKPLAYTDWRMFGETYTKFLEPKLKDKDGLNDIYGIDEGDIRALIKENIETISSDPSVAMRVESDFRALPEKIRSKYYIYDDSGNVIDYDRPRYAEDAIVASVADKKNEKYVFSQERAHRQNYNLNVARLIAQGKKEEAAKLQGQVSEHWLNQARLDVMDKKISTLTNIISNEVSGKTADESYTYIKSKYGDSIANYMRSKSELVSLNSKRASALTEMSNAAASGDPNLIKAKKAELDKLDSQIIAKRTEISYHTASANNYANNMISSSISGDVKPDGTKVSPILKEDAILINIVDIPADMSENWTELNFGSKTSLNTTRNRVINGYSPTSSSGFRVADPAMLIPSSSASGLGLYSSNSFYSSTGISKSSEDKLNKALADGTLSGQIVMMPTTKAIIDDDGARILSYMLIPKEELLSSKVGLDAATVNYMSNKYGKELAKPIISNLSIMPTDATLAETTEYIKVPVTSDFVSSDPENTGNILLNRKYADTKYRQQFDITD